MTSEDPYERANYKKTTLNTDGDPDTDLSTIYATVQSVALKQDKADTLAGYNINDAYISTTDSAPDSVSITLGQRTATVCTYSFAQALEEIAIAALKYKGILDGQSLPNNPRHGDTYISTVNRTYIHGNRTLVVEVGDMLVCRRQGDTVIWDVIQANIDGSVTARNGNGVSGNIVVFDSSGYVITDSDCAISNVVTATSAGVGTKIPKFIPNTKSIGESDIPLSAITDLQTGLSSAQSTIGSLSSALTTAQGDISTLQGNVTSINGDISDIQGDITDITGDVSSLQGDITSINGDISDVQDDISDMTGTLSDIQTDLGTKPSSAIHDIWYELTNPSGSVASLQNSINTLTDSVQTLNTNKLNASVFTVTVESLTETG